MNKLTAPLLLALLACAVTLPATADDLPHSFFGLTTGHGHTYLGSSSSDNIIAKEKTLRAFTGVALNQNLSTEVGFVDFGKASAQFAVNNAAVRQESHALYVSTVAVLPSETVKWMGRVGYDWWSASYLTSATIAGAPVYGAGSGSGHSFHYGVGMDIPLGDKSSIRIDWQRYKKIGEGVTVTSPAMPSASLSGSDITLIDAGLVLRF